jgi:hypothetical protein
VVKFPEVLYYLRTSRFCELTNRREFGDMPSSLALGDL